MKKSFKITEDGSHTLYVDDLDETYHSKHGAIQEAKHVFINAGLDYFNKSELNILEIGFGTGLNTFLTLLSAQKKEITVNYSGLEAYPLSQEIVGELNYTKELNSSTKEQLFFNKLHQEGWGEAKEITSYFNLTKKEIKLDDYQPEQQFDIIYFDAFGPNTQPEMWTKVVFEKMFDALVEGGILVTYCAKGSVKRTLKEVGFTLESLPGPPGKREMTRGLKINV
jgi:tRNA U34 5-methylaminomethyl-2-thiouridine-forming methyltransferase MnmC